MSHNCLKTELKGTSHSELPKLGEAVFVLDNIQTAEFYFAGLTSAELSGNGHIEVSGVSVGKTTNAERFTIVGASRNDKLYIVSKYNITNVTFPDKATFIEGDVDWFSKALQLNFGRYNKAAFKVEDLFMSNIVAGRIRAINMPNVSGSVEAMVERQLKNGRNSGTMDFGLFGSHVTLNGSTTLPAADSYYTITFGSDSAVIKVGQASSQGETIASYNNGTWTYYV